jgi:hypothetical protein
MQIRNDCTDPPKGLLRHIQRSLKWINPADLEGIDFIWLTDKPSEQLVENNEGLKRATEEGYCAYGFYVPKKKGSSYIMLFVKGLYQAISADPIYRITPAPTLWITRTLAHEVGHHLVAQRGYIFEPSEKYKHKEIEEEFCDRYAFNVLKKMQGRWYYRLGMWALKDIADMHYHFGTKAWKSKDYERAAEHWYNAGQLNPDHQDAVRWYWLAKSKCSERKQQVK